MADVAAMDIVIGAKIEGAERGLNAVQRELAETAIAANKTDSSFQKVSATAGKSSQTMLNLNRVIQDLPFGFTAISNNLTQLIPGVGLLGTAFTILTTAITFSQVGLSMWTRSSKETKEAIDSITESTARELLKFNELAAIAKDSNISYKTRLEAVKELRDTYPSYLKNLSDEQILAGQLKSSYDDINNALFAKATLQAAEEKVIPILRDIVKLRIDENEQLKKVKELTPPPGGPAALRRLTLTKKQSDELKSANYDLLQTVNERKGLQNELNDVLQGFYDILKTTAPLDLDKHIKTEKTKDIKDAADVIKDLTKSLKDFNTEQKGIGGDFRDKMIKAIDSAITELIKLGVAAEDPRIQNLLKLGKEIGQTFNNIKPAIANIKLTPGLDIKIDKEVTQNKINKAAGGLELPVTVKPVVPSKAAQDAMKLGIEVSESLNKILNDFIADMTTAFAEGIGNLLSGKQNPFAGLFEVLGNMLTQLGKTLIGLALGLNAIQISLKSLNPIIAAAAGIALVALGTIVKNSVKEMAMAEGGIVTGPTRALIGEAGPEVVFPLDRLREFIQPAQAQVVVLETRVRGSDIWLSQSRTNERRGRTY
jgi:hypothetical protein